MMHEAALMQERIRERAQATFRNHLSHIAGGNMKAWVELWEEEGIFEFPYGPAGSQPKKIGKLELYDYMKEFPNRFDVSFTELIFHPMADPELVVAEFKAVGKHRETGNPHNQTYVSVVEMRDGRIRHYRDFWFNFSSPLVQPATWH
ncbi:nuclear transport factor 2 family protein [Paenibacillus xanthanilyticus]|uniref:Nuclear transport factor 2 family protein n=1 Tax=Paenibacillus xanthanilyticus TaxID=1783531 RepID=A0ABV8K8N4_9BACL